MGITPNRLVAVLTPLVFAPLAGTIAVLAAEHLPGVDIQQDQIQQVFIAGALIAFGKAGLWLKGWQDWEKVQNAVPEDVANDVALGATIAPGPFAGDADLDFDPELADADPDLEPAEDEDDDDDDGRPHDNGLAILGQD
jgi:hypothetical protein